MIVVNGLAEDGIGGEDWSGKRRGLHAILWLLCMFRRVGVWLDCSLVYIVLVSHC